MEEHTMRDETFLRYDSDDRTGSRMIDSRDNSVWPVKDTGFRLPLDKFPRRKNGEA
jgi:hypothetical protein